MQAVPFIARRSIVQELPFNASEQDSGFFAESGGLLRKERECFEVKSVDSFNAKNPRGIAPGVNKKGLVCSNPFL